MTDAVALESLVQRGRSPLFKDLVTLYKESQNALKDRKNLSQHDVFVALKQIGFDVKLADIVKKHMNFPLRMVDIVESGLPNLYCAMHYTKHTRKAERLKTKTPGMQIEEINKFYNDKTGRLETDNIDNLPYTFSVGVHTSLWTINWKDNGFYFTPEELAAATLHELGHVDHFVRITMRVYYRNIDAAEIIEYTKETHDKTVILAVINGIKSSPYLDKSWDKVLETTEKYFKSSVSMDDPTHWEALSVLSAVVAADSSSRNLQTFNELMSHRVNDKVNTRVSLFDQERTADEFASRSGAYRDLIQMLTKLNQLSTTKSDFVFRQYLWYTPALFLGLMVQFATTFSLAGEDLASGYDPIIHRLELIVETAKHAFHDAALSDSAKADIKQQIIDAEKYIAQYQSTSHRKVREAVKQWRDNIGKFGRIIASPFSNRLQGDYTRLQDANRSLSRHPLYYLANK